MFKQLGYSFKDASEYMASNAMILSNVGDMSVQDSSNAIVSTLKGFKMEAQDTTKVVDVLNETGNNFAITTGQLADGLRIGSASLAIANNSLEESIALITTGTEVLRDSDMVANGLKNISMRLRGVADEEGNLEPKMRELVKSLTGKDIMNANGSFKSTYQIMKELGSVWDTLGDKQRAYLAEAVSGKQRANIFASIMQNAKQLDKVYDTATNSDGSAEKEQEAYMNSISGKINALKENFKGLFMDNINSDAFKTVIDIANGGITVFRELGNQFGSLPVLISTVVASLNLFSTKFNEGFIGQLPILKQMNSFFDSWKASIKADTVATTVNTTAKEANNMASASGIVNSKGETISTVANTGAKVANTTATVASTVATGAMTVAVSALQAVMSFGLSLAVTGIISGIIKLGDSLVTTKAELKEFNEETSKSVSETQQSVSSAEGYIKKIEQLNNAISNTSDEEKKKEITEQLTQAQKDLAQAMPEATDNYSDDGKAMATSIEFTKEIIQLKKDEMKINAQKFFDENKGLLSDIDELDKKKAKLKEYQVALAQGKDYVTQDFTTKDERGIETTKSYKMKINSDDVKKLNDDIMQTTKTASEARVMAKYLGDDATDADKKMIDGVESYTRSLQKNTEEKKNNNNVDMKSLTPEQQNGVYAGNINVLAGAIKELNDSSNLSEDSVKRLANAMPNLDMSNMSAKEKVDALTKALKDQKDAMDKTSLDTAKQGQKDFVEQAEEVDKINGYLKTMGDNGKMSLDIMKELATSKMFEDFTGDLTNMSQVQEYFNSKLDEMKSKQGESYSTMMGNSREYYQQQLNNGDNLQNAFNQWASNFVNINGGGYDLDVRNFNTLNEAKVGMINQVAGKMGEFLAQFVGGSADAYAKELRNCTDWATMKAKILEKLQEQINKVQQALADTESRANQINASTANGDLNNAQAEKMYRIEQDRLANLNNAKQKIDTSFDEFNRSFSGYTPQGLGSSYSGNSDKANKSSEKTINYLIDETDRYLDLKDAIDKVNDAIDQNDAKAEKKTGQEKIGILQQQINLYNQLRTARINLKNAEQGRLNELRGVLASQGFGFNGEDLIGSQNRLQQLQNYFNSIMNSDNEKALKNQYDGIKC
jgi:TP901 family phage tail tape measure protein